LLYFIANNKRDIIAQYIPIELCNSLLKQINCDSFSTLYVENASIPLMNNEIICQKNDSFSTLYVENASIPLMNNEIIHQTEYIDDVVSYNSKSSIPNMSEYHRIENAPFYLGASKYYKPNKRNRED
jgi:hypothetical protein